MGRKNSKKGKNKEKQGRNAGKTFTGILDITRSGMGFVIAEQAKTDILVRPGDLNTALHGDKVSVRIGEEKRGKRLQGVIEDVLVRRRTEFVGRFEMNKGFGFFIAEMDKPMPDIFIPLPRIGSASDGDRVIVRLLEWEKGDRRPIGEVVSVMDPENANEAAMKELLLEAGFPLQFGENAQEVAARIPDSISADDLKNRKDMRKDLTSRLTLQMQKILMMQSLLQDLSMGILRSVCI